MKATPTLSVPRPFDPRTPLQAAQEKLAAANSRMCHETLGRTARQELVDRITELSAEVVRLLAQATTAPSGR